MLLNMTELSVAQWSLAQLDAARKLCTDGVLHDGPLPTILPNDSTTACRCRAYQAAIELMKLKPDAIIVQGEPVFVSIFVDKIQRSSNIPCYSPCYKDGKFVQFRRF